MSIMRIIGIIGKRRTGKDTVADYVTTHYGFEKKKFAAPMKAAMEVLFGFSKDQLETDLKDEIDDRWGVSPRTLMQSMGTQFLQYELQKIIPELGHNYAVKRLFIQDDLPDKIIISDVRFIHEVDEIKKRGGLLIKLIRDNNKNNNIDAHISEKGVDELPFDQSIENNASLKDLYQKIDQILSE